MARTSDSFARESIGAVAYCIIASAPASFWVDPADPSNSLIVGANKRESLSVFRLDGQRISERQTGGSNNVDIRGGISVGGRNRIIVGATSPRGARIDLFELDAASGQLLDIAAAPIHTVPEVETSGFCFYRSAQTGDLFAISTDQSGLIEQRRLSDNGAGRITAGLIRQLRVDSEQEGCVAAFSWFRTASSRSRASPGKTRTSSWCRGMPSRVRWHWVLREHGPAGELGTFVQKRRRGRRTRSRALTPASTGSRYLGTMGRRGVRAH